MRRFRFIFRLNIFINRYNFLEHAGVLGGNQTVLMHGAENPMLILAHFIDFLKIAVDFINAVGLSAPQQHCAFN